MTRRLIDHSRPYRRGIAPIALPPLEWLMRSIHRCPIYRHMDRNIDGQALNYQSTRKEVTHDATRA